MAAGGGFEPSVTTRIRRSVLEPLDDPAMLVAQGGFAPPISRVMSPAGTAKLPYRANSLLLLFLFRSLILPGKLESLTVVREHFHTAKRADASLLVLVAIDHCFIAANSDYRVFITFLHFTSFMVKQTMVGLLRFELRVLLVKSQMFWTAKL